MPPNFICLVFFTITLLLTLYIHHLLTPPKPIILTIEDYIPQHIPSKQYNTLRVCMIANVQNAKLAWDMARQWPSFTKVAVVWGEKYIPLKDENIDNLWYVDGIGKSHAEGWAAAYSFLKSKRIPCDYYFTNDDDLVWIVTSGGRRHYHQNTPQETLLAFLQDYQPAVTVFRWVWGQALYPELRQIESEYADEIALPATGFDNGAMIFHSSVADIFIPCYMGDQFVPAFVVQHPYYNLMIPFLYTKNAIKFTGIEYYNPPEVVRHAYDDDEADKFRAYVKEHLLCRHKRWGATLRAKDMSWKPERGIPPYHVDPYLQSLAFFDGKEALMRKHPILEKIGWTEDLISQIAHMSATSKVCEV